MNKRIVSPVLLLVLSLLMVACGSQASSSGSATNTSGSTPTTAPATSSPLIKVTTATVKGTSESILTNAQGMTLYYFTPDTASTSACTASCASNWPALLSKGGTPSSATALPGSLTTVTTANGTQVAYNGHLLYTFAGDSTAGQTNGEGIGGKWFVATPDVKSLGAQQTTPQAKGRGY